MSGEIPKTFEQSLEGMTPDQLDDMGLNAEAELLQEEQELLDFDTKIASIDSQVQPILQKITELEEKIRIIETAEAAASGGATGAGTGPTSPTGMPPAGEPDFDEMLRQAEAASAAHAGEADPGRPTPAAADPAHPAEEYVWGGPNEEALDKGSWKISKWLFEKGFGLVYDKILGMGNTVDFGNSAAVAINKHMWLKAGLTFLVKVPAKVFGLAIFTTTPAQYFFEKGMVKDEQEKLKKHIKGVQETIQELLSKETPATPEDETAITAKTNEMEGVIDHLAYVPAEWKATLKDRLKLLLKDYRQNRNWEDERYGIENARILNEYIVTKITREEILADALSTGAIGLNYLIARGISSAGLGIAGRYSKENHNYERVHWKEKRLVQTREQADQYEAQRVKEAALLKVLEKGGREWLDNQFIGSLKKGNFWWGEGSHFNPFSKEFWNEERIKFVQGTSMTLRGLGVLAATAHMTELDPNRVGGVFTALKDHGLSGGLTSVYENFWHNWDNVWTNVGRVRSAAGKAWDWVWNGSIKDDVAVTPPITHTPPAPHPVEHIEAPKIAFDIRNIRGLRDLGYVQKSSELYFDNRVHMREVDGVRFETQTIERWEGSRKVLVEQIISLNNRNVGYPIDITSEKQFFDTINDSTHYEEPFEAPVKNTKFNYWIENRPDGNKEFHRFWQKNDIDYEIKGTSIYKDATTGKLYALHPGEKVHSNDDPLQKLMEYRVVGVRMPDGSYHSVDVQINDPLHGQSDPNVGFNRLHKDMMAEKIGVDTFKAPRQPLPSDEVAPVKPAPTPAPAPKAIEKTPIVPTAPTKPVAPPVIIPPTKPAEVSVTSTAPVEVVIAPTQPIVEPVNPTPTSAAQTIAETPPEPVSAPPQPTPAEIVPATPAATNTPPAPVDFTPGTSGRGVDPTGPQSSARMYSSSALRYAFGREGRGADEVDFTRSHGGRLVQPYSGPFIPPGRGVDPAGPIGRDLREAIAAEDLKGDFTATSSGRIVQKMFDRKFLVEHGMKPGQLTDAQVLQLQNLKGNMGLLLEGKNVKGGDLPSITQDELRKAVDVTHEGKNWSVDVTNETQWKGLMNKLINRAQHNFPEHPAPAPRVDVIANTHEEAPKNLPVAEEPVTVPQPKTVDESIGLILKNNSLSDSAQYRAVSSVIGKLEKGNFTLHTNTGDVKITKLGTGVGAFIRLPGETHSRFWSPTTAAAIEKLLRK